MVFKYKHPSGFRYQLDHPSPVVTALSRGSDWGNQLPARDHPSIWLWTVPRTNFSYCSPDCSSLLLHSHTDATFASLPSRPISCFPPTQWLSRPATRIVQQSPVRQLPLRNTILSTLPIYYKFLIFPHFHWHASSILFSEGTVRSTIMTCLLDEDLITTSGRLLVDATSVGSCILVIRPARICQSNPPSRGFASTESIWSCYEIWWQYILQIC